MAAARKPLRTVKPDERANRKPPTTIAEAVDYGTDLEMLELSLARVAVALDDPNCPTKDLAALTRRLQELRKDIAAVRAASAEEGNGPADTADEAFDAQAL